jgi:cytochrome c553
MKLKTMLFIATLSSLSANTFNPEMSNYIKKLKIEAKKTDSSFVDFDSSRGEILFTTKHKGKKGDMISCVSCHNSDLKTTGKNIFTNKPIEPLSPKANSQRLTDVKDVEKWLKRNFNDVYVREGSAKEKGDVLYYINSK